MERHNHLAREIVDAAFKVHTQLGPGLFESVYELVLTHEINKRGFSVARQQPIAVHYDGLCFDEGFRADLVIEDTLIVELKSVEKVAPVHKKQLLTYLRLSGKRLGLLINFGEPLIKNGIFRIENGL